MPSFPGKAALAPYSGFLLRSTVLAGLGVGLGDHAQARDPLGNRVIRLEGVGSVRLQPFVSSARGFLSSDALADEETEARRSRSSFPVPKAVGGKAGGVSPSPRACPEPCPALPRPCSAWTSRLLLLSRRIRAAFQHAACRGSRCPALRLVCRPEPALPPVPKQPFPALRGEKGLGFLPATLLRIRSARGTPWW